MDKYTKKELWEALSYLVRLQAHYAYSLNLYDGGKRIEFKSAEEYMERVKKFNKEMEDK